MKWIAISGALAFAAAFLPGQGGSNQVWEHFRSRYDSNGDGRVTQEEHGRGEEQFRNLDRNRDGALSAADFEIGSAPPELPQLRVQAVPARTLGQFFGTFLNRDGEPGLSEEDWDALLTRLEPGPDGVISPDKLNGITGISGRGPLAMMAGRPSEILDHDRDGTVTEGDVRAVFAAMDGNGNGLVEQGTEIDMPPGVGEVAPDFALPLVTDAERHVTLSSFRGEKPVALIFGSYT